MRIIRDVFFGPLLLLFFLLCPANIEAASSNRVVVYYTNWSQYRSGSCRFVPENIKPEYLTYLNYAFAKIGPDDKVRPVEWNDILDYAPGMYQRVNALKVQYPQLKTLISIGGWTLSNQFPLTASSKGRRATFIQSAMQYARVNDFDGIDLDWEYPGFAEHAGTPQDKENFTALLQEFRDAIDAEPIPSGTSKLLLTIAAPAGEANFNNIELSKIHLYLDWINLMTYDFHGNWDSFSGVHSPLLHDSVPGGHFYADFAVRGYLNAGIPADKLVLGIPAYGRTYGNVSDNLPNSPINNPWAARAPQGSCTGEAGFMSYYEIRNLLAAGTYTVAWDANTSTPYAYDNLGNWISYENETSVQDKLDYIQQMRLGGAMVWSIDLDDNYILISRIANNLIGTASVSAPPPEPAPSPAPAPAPAPAPVPSPTPPPPASDAPLIQILSPDVQLTLSVESKWGTNEPWSGATMKGLLTNTSAEKTFSQIQIKTSDAGINIWSMDPVSKNGNETIVQLPSWQGGLAAGQSYSFGFTISPNKIPTFVLQESQGSTVVGPEPAPSPAPSPEPLPNNEGGMNQILGNGLTLTLHVDSQWGTTEAWAGASVTAILKNTSAAILFSPLKLSANMGTGFSVWSMDVISKTVDETVIDLPNYQEKLGPGESFIFGFNVSPVKMPVFRLK